MKKMIAFVLAGSLAVSTPAYASEIDISALDFAVLSELKQRVDAEYHSRPEAEPFQVVDGYYTVGKDIKPGLYYVGIAAPTEDGYGVRMHVYVDKAQYAVHPAGKYGEYLTDDYFSFGEEPKGMTFEEGNYLYIQGTLLFSPGEYELSDYYTYEVPDGTYVPAGAYMVGDGEDKNIPTGTFTVYAGTIYGGDIKIYDSQEKFADDGSWHLDYDKHYEIPVKKSMAYETIVLEEGNVLYVEKDVVLRKGTDGTKLIFD